MPSLPALLPTSSRSIVLAVGLTLVAMIATACAGPTATPSSSHPTGSASPGESAGPSPSAGPTVGPIEHATGPTDVVLRLEQGGGFVPMEFLATQAPDFTLFGNGVIVFKQAPTTVPEPDASGVLKAAPWRTASLDEGQIQDLLAFALGPGGLGSARDSYISGGIADAPNTIFTVHAGGVDKMVVVNALGIDTAADQDAAARAAFARLAQRLQDFDQGGTIGSDVYQPERFRGVLTPRDPAPAAAMAWPWSSLTPADFKEGANDGGGGPTLPHRTMTPAEVAALKLGDVEGGVQGLTLAGPSGATYGFILRPLLADEQE